MNKKNNRKGFTITELVIVIAVIAILAAVLIPTFTSIISKANDSAALQDARATYSEYMANVDYSVETAATDLVVKVSNDEWLIVNDGVMNTTVFETESAAYGSGGLGLTAGGEYTLLEKGSNGAAPIDTKKTVPTP